MARLQLILAASLALLCTHVVPATSAATVLTVTNEAKFPLSPLLHRSAPTASYCV